MAPMYSNVMDIDADGNESSRVSNSYKSQDSCPARSWYSAWAQELIALIASWVSLGCLGFVLLKYDGKQQHSSITGFITLNGLIAILFTVARASLLYAVAVAISQSKWAWFSSHSAQQHGRPLQHIDLVDQASRGAWGSVLAIFDLRGRRFLCLGSLVMILALAFDTFVQQLLSTRVSVIGSTQFGDISPVFRAEQYTVLDQLAIGGSSDNLQVNTPLRAAVYNGIYFTDNVTPITQCRSGNCTWPIVPTLGACGSSKNMTDQLVYNKTTTRDYPSSMGTTLATWSLPSLSNQNNSNVWRRESDMAYGQRVFVVSSPVPTASPNTTGDIYLSETTLINMPYGTPIRKSEPSQVQAISCSIRLCVQALNVSTYNQSYTETITATHTNFSYFKSSNGSEEKFIASDLPLFFNAQSGTSFSMSYWTVLDFQQLTSVIKGYINGQENGVTDYYYASDNDAITAPLWSYANNFTAWNDNFAALLTTVIRAGGISPTAANTTYQGTAHFNIVVYHVRWLWIVYPAAVLAMATVFLLGSIWVNQHGSVPVLKDSSVALLNLAKDEALTQRFAAHTGRPHQLLAAIGDTKVRLGIGDNSVLCLEEVR